jgi:hypothetical protein
MSTRWSQRIGFSLFAAAALAGLAPAVLAAPAIQAVSPRGLRAGATTTVTIDGADLLPEPRVFLPVPVAGQTVKQGAAASRVQIALTLAKDVAPGFYLFRVANAKGFSNAVIVAVDDLEQTPLAPETPRLPAALYGTLSDSAAARTTFAGKKGQRVVAEVEARRLGSALDPLLELYDARRVQLAWSQGLPVLSGDARLEATLPADGSYTVELRDALYRAGPGSAYRLKVGDLRYADLAFPLAVQRGTRASVQLIGNVPADTRAEVDLGFTGADHPVPLPRVTGLTGAAPAVLVSDLTEVVEATTEGKPQEVTAPVAVNGRLSAPREEDRYRLLVKPGMQLRFDVLAERAGSPLDGVLVVRNGAGAQLASSDDRPNTVDPGLDFTVPQGATALLVTLTDLHGRGGPNYVYRIAVTQAGQPDFSLTLLDDRSHVPQAGTTLVRVRASRAGYGGPIKLSVPELPADVVVSGDEIPAGATDTLLSLSAPPGIKPRQLLTKVVGESTDPKVALRRTALLAETAATQNRPWMRGELAVGVVEPVPIRVEWDTAEPNLPIGQNLTANVKVDRDASASGPVRLSLVTSQVVPRTKDGKQDDAARALRMEGTPMIAANQTEGTAKILIPGDLPAQPYDLAVRAELLSADGKAVVATAVTPGRRLTAAKPAPPPKK